MPAKLWQTNTAGVLHPAVEAYTVGDDYVWDQKLLGYDIRASQSHASMLQAAGILTDSECSELLSALDALYQLWAEGTFVVRKEQEDGHTAIEAYLVEQLGDTGKKIHTARSRNDQALVMMRLYLKDALQDVSIAVDGLVDSLTAALQVYGDIPMPGYTHMQKAMPTTVGCWLGSYAEGFRDMQQLVKATRDIIDQNPLGSAAGFGTLLPIDRSHTTKALGFKKTQSNPMYCGLSRGLFESLAVQALNPIMLLAGKFASDMVLFTTQEFGFFSMPDTLTTGSSIMPHKHNHDLFEVMRGQAHAFQAYAQQIQAITGGVGSGYNRDLQLTKSITLRAFSVALETLQVLQVAVANIEPNVVALEASVTPEMLSVSKIDELVGKGVPFRDAYLQVKETLGQAA